MMEKEKHPPGSQSQRAAMIAATSKGLEEERDEALCSSFT